MIDRLVQDIRHAIRQTMRAPGFAVAVIVTLALAIGANAALFSLVNALVLRTVPVRNPEELVVLQATDERGQQNRPLYYSSYAELTKLPVFNGLALYSGGGLFRTEARGATNEGLIEASTPGLFETLGLRPHLGRFFTTDDSPGDGPAARVVVISYIFWMRAIRRRSQGSGRERADQRNAGHGHRNHAARVQGFLCGWRSRVLRALDVLESRVGHGSEATRARAECGRAAGPWCVAGAGARRG